MYDLKTNFDQGYNANLFYERGWQYVVFYQFCGE